MPENAQPQIQNVVIKRVHKPRTKHGYQFEFRTQVTPRKLVKFLKALTRTANVTVAAESCKISRTCLYEHREVDLDFAKAWDAAMNIAVDRLEFRAHQRAFDGTDKPLVYKGEITRDANGDPVTIKEYSDTLTIFLLKAHRPEKYRDNTNVNVSGTLTLEALLGAVAKPAEIEPPAIDGEFQQVPESDEPKPTE
jgi:hypothetical protein